MVGPPALLVPGACVAGFHPQDCLLRWVVAPTSRRFLNARFPAPGHLGAYIFRPFAAFRLPVEATGAWRRLSVLQVPHVSEGYWTQTTVGPVARVERESGLNVDPAANGKLALAQRLFAEDWRGNYLPPLRCARRDSQACGGGAPGSPSGQIRKVFLG